eukprot:scaffold7682_cov137-Skeletonema_dohrnii-CCMP3373.AAC.3
MSRERKEPTEGLGECRDDRIGGDRERNLRYCLSSLFKLKIFLFGAAKPKAEDQFFEFHTTATSSIAEEGGQFSHRNVLEYN